LRIPISTIKINPGRRETDPTHIDELSQSIADVGLLNPITVDSSHTLIAGLHRLEAAKLLDWTEIECTVCSIDSIRAELAEIDENVIRRNLTNAELSSLLARRKKLYETLHPETIARNRPGHVNNYQSSSDNVTLEPKVKSFVEDTAEKLGVSTRTIERRLWLAEHLAPGAAKILKEMGKQQPSQGELMRLARLAPDQQEKVVSLLAAGAIISIDEYLKRSVPNMPKVEEKDSSDGATYFDKFMDFSSKILDDLENFCTSFVMDAATLTSEEAETIQAQANKLCAVINRLTAQSKGAVGT
jgi:ParB family chromosome partitioning protein